MKNKNYDSLYEKLEQLFYQNYYVSNDDGQTYEKIEAYEYFEDYEIEEQIQMDVDIMLAFIRQNKTTIENYLKES